MKNMTWVFSIGLILTLLGLIIFGTNLFPPTQPEKSKIVLEDRGFTEIQIKGYAWFNCSEDDFFRTKFKAVSSTTGRPVKGVVCSGFFKGSTIRMF